MRTQDVLIEKNFQGALVASAIIHGRRIHRVYMGYTKAYVKRDFVKYAKEQNALPL